MARLPPLNALKAFEASGRSLNFRAAAEELGVTQGAVAQQVRSLEQLLGVMLFDRLPRGLALTDEGRRYHASVHRAFTLIAEATDDVSPGQNILTISVTPTFATRWLVSRLGDFSTRFPEIDVRVDASQKLVNFQSDGIDIAVRQGKPPFGPGLVSTLLFPLEYYVVCSPELLTGERPLNSVADLEHHVLLQDSHGLWPLFLEKAAGDTDRSLPRRVDFNQTSLAIDAALAGQGVALASEHFVSDELKAGRLVRPFPETIVAEDGFHIVAPRKQRKPDLYRIMSGWLTDQVAGG